MFRIYQSAVYSAVSLLTRMSDISIKKEDFLLYDKHLCANINTNKVHTNCFYAFFIIIFLFFSLVFITLETCVVSFLIHVSMIRDVSQMIIKIISVCPKRARILRNKQNYFIFTHHTQSKHQQEMSKYVSDIHVTSSNRHIRVNWSKSNKEPLPSTTFFELTHIQDFRIQYFSECVCLHLNIFCVLFCCFCLVFVPSKKQVKLYK